MTRDKDQIITQLRKAAFAELKENILPFWMKNMPDMDKGGFHGRIDGRGNIISDAPRGAILNARILWTFSAASCSLRDRSYLETAARAYDYIMAHFFDDEYGGTYWSLSSDGEPRETKKQIYSQAFFIYALSEYYMASGFERSREKAVELFHLIEEYSFDRQMNGYFEAFDRQWGVLADLRLSDKDANEKKTMNTHLHILEAYTNLYRIWPDEVLKRQLKNMVHLFAEKIIDPVTSHLNLFFDENWLCKSTLISYGHDIEASWLLYEAACVTGDDDLAGKTAALASKVVTAALEGMQGDGSLLYERDDASGHLDADRHWWVQAEAVVGLINAWEMTGEEKFLRLALKSFDYIENYLVDRLNGEWYWSIRADGTINTADDKAGFWKCPYHNGRMCLEIIKRFQV